MKRTLWLSSILAIGLCVSGFDFTKHSIDVDQIMAGGPPKDGIPAIMNPRFIPASEATWLTDQDELIGIVEGDVARAYPLRILTWHEVVNDTIGEKSIAVTYGCDPQK